MLRIIPPSNFNCEQVTSWKDDNSKTIKPFDPGSFKDVAALPIFPPTSALISL